MKRLVGGLILSAVVGTAGAAELLHYSFTTNETGTIVAVNRANPGTWDATAGSYGIVGDKKTVPWGADAANMPAYDSGFHELVPHMLVQTGDEGGPVTPTGGALKWDGAKIQGGLRVDQSTPFRPGVRTVSDGGAVQAAPFTIECCVRLPPGAATRANEMFPIIQVGNDLKRGWIFSIYKGRPFFRWTWKKVDGTVAGNGWTGYTPLSTAAVPSLYDGRWHQIAVAFNDNGSDQCCARTYIDGTQVGAQRATANKDGWTGLYYGEAGDDVPFVIGGHPYQDNRTFWGELAELRISDVRLDNNRFCVAGAAGPVTADTAVMLPFGENARDFGFATHPLAKFTCDGNADTYYIARNWNLRNAATNDVLQPRWFSYDDVTDGHARPATEEGAPGAVIRAESTAAPAYADGDCLAFRPNTANGDLIHIPGAAQLATNDFTLEVFYKTTADTKSSAQTLLCSEKSFLSKLCLYQNRLLLRVAKTDGSNPGDLSTPTGVALNDGKWHHAAVTYNAGTKVVRLYSDYRLVGFRSGVELRSVSTTFLVGGVHRSSQLFDGALDNLRITRRELKVGEFLSARDFVSDRCLEATFDTPERPWASGQDPELMPDAEPVACGEGTPSGPELVAGRSGWVLDGEDGPRLREGGKAVRLDGGYVHWRHTPTLEREAWTFEFFAKLFQVNASGDTALLRFALGDAVGNSSMVLLTHRGANEYGPDRLVWASSPSSPSSTGETFGPTVQVKIGDVPEGQPLCDGKWHHWALAVEQRTEPAAQVVARLYRDYEPWGEEVRLDGRIVFPASGSGCNVALGNPQGGLKAVVDDLRVSPGILPVARFLRFEPKQGLMVIVR